MTWSNSVSARWRLSVGALMVLSLVACGGGGGGGDGKSGGDQPSGKISLGGVVSKGLTGRALVKVYGVTSGGGLDTAAPLAEGTTDDQGVYVTGEFTAPATYVVEVRARDCADTSVGTNCSFHQDEATDARQYLPTGFVMRTVVTTTPSNKKVNVTALSELAYSMATKANGGLTATNAQKAIANISSVVGVADINTVEPKPLGVASTDDEKRVAALLEAVSGLASDSSALTTLSCTAEASSPEATKCVVEKLAANANVAKPTGDNVAVTTALADQLDAVTEGDLELQALTSAAETKLKDETIVYENAGGSSAPPASLADKVRQFFNELTSTIRSLFDNSIGGESGAVKQARDFKSAVEAVQVDLQPAIYTAAMAEKAAELWVNYEAGPGGRVEQSIDREGSRCWLTNDLSTVEYNPITPGAPASSIAGVRCTHDASYEYQNYHGSNGDGTANVDKKVGLQWFVLRKSGSSYVYTTSNIYAYYTAVVSESDWSEISRTYTEPDQCAWPAASASVCDGYDLSGTVQVTKAEDNRLAAVRIQGSAPDGWKWRQTGVHPTYGYPIWSLQLNNGYSLSNRAKSTIDLRVDVKDSNGTLVSAAGGNLPGGITATFSGPITLVDVDGSTQLATASIDVGSKLVVENQEATIADFRLTYAKAGSFKLQGQLTMTRAVNDGGSSTFKGDLYNGSATTPFISAEIQFGLDRTHYDAAQPHSDSNYEIGTFTFDGFVTAPDRPKLRLLVNGGARVTTESNVPSTWGATAGEDYLSANYLIYNASGSVRQDVTITTGGILNGDVGSAVISDSTSGVRLNWTRGATSAPITISGQNVGTLGNGGSQAQVTFNPATTGETGYFLLDFGAQPTW